MLGRADQVHLPGDGRTVVSDIEAVDQPNAEFQIFSSSQVLVETAYFPKHGFLDREIAAVDFERGTSSSPRI